MIADLEKLIGLLAAPVSDQELADGWTPEAKAGIANYFRNQKDSLDREAVSGLIRGMDAWGVSQGDLFQEALRVNRALR